MRTTDSEVVVASAVAAMSTGLCDEALAILEETTVSGRDLVELGAVCQRLGGIARLLQLQTWQQELVAVDDRLFEETRRKRLRRMAKRVRKVARSKRDRDAAKLAAAFVDRLPDSALAVAEAAALAERLRELQREIVARAAEADADSVWLKCRRDYGRVRGLGAAWRDGESRIDYCEWQRLLTCVYTQLCVLAPRRQVDHESWEAFIRMVADRGALGGLRRHLLLSSSRLSPAFVVPRTVALIDELADRLNDQIAEAHAACFEARPRSYFAHLRHG